MKTWLFVLPVAMVLAGCGGGGGGSSTPFVPTPLTAGAYHGTFVDASGTFHAVNANDQGVLTFDTTHANPNGQIVYPDATVPVQVSTSGNYGLSIGDANTAAGAQGVMVQGSNLHYTGSFAVTSPSGTVQSQPAAVDIVHN